MSNSFCASIGTGLCGTMRPILHDGLLLSVTGALLCSVLLNHQCDGCHLLNSVQNPMLGILAPVFDDAIRARTWCLTKMTELKQETVAYMKRYQSHWRYSTRPPRWILIADNWWGLVTQTTDADTHWSAQVERRKGVFERYSGPAFTDSLLARQWCEAKIGELQM